MTMKEFSSQGHKENVPMCKCKASSSASTSAGLTNASDFQFSRCLAPCGPCAVCRMFLISMTEWAELAPSGCWFCRLHGDWSCGVTLAVCVFASTYPVPWGSQGGRQLRARPGLWNNSKPAYKPSCWKGQVDREKGEGRMAA